MMRKLPSATAVRGFQASSSSSTASADAIIVGAGVAGIATALHLSKAIGKRHCSGSQSSPRIVLVDPRDPMSFTSSMSTEAFRTFWSEPSMAKIMGRSIDLVEQLRDESGNAFQMKREGYAFFTANQPTFQALLGAVDKMATISNQKVAHHQSHQSDVPSADNEDVDIDIFHSREHLLGNLGSHFDGILTDDVDGGIIARNAGWLNAHVFGMTMLEEARRHAEVVVLSGHLKEANFNNGKFQGAHVELSDNSCEYVSSPVIVNAAGPFINHVQSLLEHGMGRDDLTFPLRNDIHAKCIFEDREGVIPREGCPMMIWMDPVEFKWTDEEKEFIASEWPQLLEQQAVGAHLRPYGNGRVLFVWDIGHAQHVAASGSAEEHSENDTKPPPNPQFHPLYQELCLRGLSHMVPGLAQAYLGEQSHIVPGIVDGGYYTKCPDQLPLVGTVEPGSGAYTLGGLAGFGIMGSNGFGEMIAKLVTHDGDAMASFDDSQLEIASKFDPMRFTDKSYLARVLSQKSDEIEL